ncbi:endonuclease/exonuclease/phosphatase family protein [Planomonospora sp. ID67723]|uniref:endonuclease/exonuclease/phosphatase family protein n=1 Tax=Planomonospora sp. ID67723 TaxID=2738134 RepID=UPI0018C3F8B9|nr:endonuclease/exonuclease/phosphatase family protein [Planomonospora sp. ID67723]MBG0829777.1 endonuclease/exonuclease/phosphatase family protein [Planomonospora sp. ID67723]
MTRGHPARPAGDGPGPETVRVMSLNVCCGLRSPLPPPTDRAAEFCRRIERSDTGVVNFQEVWTPGLLRFLRRRLPSFPFAAWRAGTAGQPAGGLVTFSRLPLRSVAYTPFRGARPETGSPAFLGLLTLKSLVQGVLTVELAGRRTVIGNAHLTANKDGDWSEGNRHYAFQRAQLGLLHRALGRAHRGGADLTIVSGDFNIAAEGPLYSSVVDGGAWHDPFRSAARPTFHADLLPPGQSARRVDYLLVRGDLGRHPVTEAATLFAEPVPLPGGGRSFLSDHLALSARVVIPSAT